MAHHFWLIGFIIGVLGAGFIPLPWPGVWIALVVILVLILWTKTRLRKFFIATLIGAIWMALHLQIITSQTQSLLQLSQPTRVELEILHQTPTLTKARLRRVNDKPIRYLRFDVQLKDKSLTLKPHQIWSIDVLFDEITGLNNPGFGNIKKNLAAQHIFAKATVKNPDTAVMLGARPMSLIQRYREMLQNAIGSPSHIQNIGMLRALATGDRSTLDESTWSLLRETGTAHLMAISGLHVGWVFLLAFRLMRWCGIVINRRFHICPVLSFAYVGALILSLGYVCLSGASISSLRAWYLCLCMVLWLFFRRRISMMHALSLVVAWLLVVDPFAVYSSALWLSAGAVAIIAWHYQYVIFSLFNFWDSLKSIPSTTLIIIPLSILFLSSLSWVSPVANLVAIPVVSFIVVPMLLVFDVTWMLCEPIANFVLMMTDHVMTWLVFALENINAWISYREVHLLSARQWGIWFLITILTLTHKGFPGRIFILIPCAALLWPAHPKPHWGDYWVDVIDVGQGLSVLVRTREHSLLFDAGHPVVAPYLTRQHVNALDTLVISHADWDHRWGLSSVLENIPVNEFYSSQVLADVDRPYDRCMRGESWTWEGVSFTFMNPLSSLNASGNDQSCVLLIRSGAGSVLLTGDIEKKAERALLAQSGRLSADILLSPHHGSATSSTEAFLRAVSPKAVIISSGYHNRYKHPHPDVIQRYHALHIQDYNTAQHGALRVTLTQNAMTISCAKNDQLTWPWLKGETC